MRFEFASATQIIFGGGVLREVGEIAVKFGKRALVVTGGTPERARPLCDRLAAQSITTMILAVSGEPTTDLILQGVRQAQAGQCEFVIGYGGGSALDTGKAIAALLTNGGDLLDYLEVIGRGQLLSKASAPYIAIPTTTGPGTEVTCNAVLKSQVVEPFVSNQPNPLTDAICREGIQRTHRPFIASGL